MFHFEFEELKNKILSLKNKINLESKILKLQILQELTEKAIDYKSIINELKIKKNLEEEIESYNKIINQFDYLTELIGINDTNSNLEEEILREIKKIEQDVDKFYIQLCFTEKDDFNNCFLEINTGVGGIDSQDWSSILMRMYLNYLNKNKKFQSEIIEMSSEDIGIKSATIKIKGDFAYGTFKHETGIHRLVRISPFNSNDKRQTSFCGVFVYPEIDETITFEIQEKDLKIDCFRAGGAGGQHVNKTDSAVRITHIPSGIVVKSQEQRSQIQNRSSCMSMLKAKLYELEKSKFEKSKNEAQESKKDISWGNQIRSYVMHPYQMVKDLRTLHETSKIEDVLNGNIEDFLTKNILYTE